MRKSLPLHTLFLVLALAGCRSDPPKAPAPASPATRPERADAGDPDALPDPQSRTPPAQKAPAPNPDLRSIIVCFGDSLTAGFGTGLGQSYPDYLQAGLDAAHRSFRVQNEGVSGNTTKDGVERLPNIVALHPTLVLVEFGGNDGLRGLRIEDTRANLDTIVATLQKSGARVALAGITLPPDYGPDYIQQFTSTYTLLAKKYHTPLYPFLLKDVYGLPGMMQRDNIHATAQGNRIVARNILAFLGPMLKH